MPNDTPLPNLLRTKVQIPPARLRRVLRPRLTMKLDAGLQGKLTLISATAGSGKTTLLEEWHQTSTDCCRLAWLSLEPNDDDWSRFWSYVIAAFQTVAPGLGSSVSLSLQSIPLPEFAAASDEPTRRESTLTALLNELAELPDDIVLVLDDYHVIKSVLIHESLTYFIDRLPGHVHVVIATREDPPLPLACWRARNQLTEIRAADLQFTVTETAAFFTEVMQLTISAADVQALEERTEGWIAGLQLAALSIRDQQPSTNFVASFTGSHRFILDYLVEEVLRVQPPELKDILLQTSILDRLTAALCDSLTGRADSQIVLEQLEASNLFIVPLDTERRWYRYHRLFADLLQHQLQLTQPDRLTELHRRASTWFEQADFILEAIQHSLAAGDLDRVADLIEHTARRTWLPWLQADLGPLVAALESLPSDRIRARPQLCLAYAWACLITPGRIDRVEPYVQAALESAGTPPDSVSTIRGEALALRTFIASLRGEADLTIELARQALDVLPVNEQLLRSVVAWSLGSAYALKLDMLSAERAQREALATSRAVGLQAVTLMAMHQLAEIQCSLGQLREAAGQLAAAIDLAKRWGGENFFLMSRTWWTLGLIHYEWNDLDAAAHCLETSIRIGTQWNYTRLLPSAYGLLALVKQARGDMAGAVTEIRRAQQTAQDSGLTTAANVAAANQLWVWSAQDDLTAAMQWVQARETDWSDPTCHLHLIAGTAIAFVLIEYSWRHADSTWLPKVQRLLQDRLQQAEATGLVYDVIEILPLQALAYHVQGDTPHALTLLARALTLAEPEGYVRMFVNCGDLMAELLLIGLRKPIFDKPPVRAFVTRLLSHWGISAPTVESSAAFPHTAPDREVDQFVEPLTERELKVLQLAATGASDQQIADHLVLSKATIKTHLRNIYGKLQVSNRTQAVARARVLRWLP